MARPRKPTNVLELKGAFKHDPQRATARANEPEPIDPIGEAPEYLSEFERACWEEIVQLAHAGVLCSADRLIVEHTARALASLRQNPVYEDTKLMIRLEAGLGKLGLTPADRSRVQMLKPKDGASPFEEFTRAG